MPVPTEFGSARSSLKWTALGVEILLTLALDRVQYFLTSLRVAEGAFLAAENVGTQRTEHDSEGS